MREAVKQRMRMYGLLITTSITINLLGASMGLWLYDVNEGLALGILYGSGIIWALTIMFSVTRLRIFGLSSFKILLDSNKHTKKLLYSGIRLVMVFFCMGAILSSWSIYTNQFGLIHAIAVSSLVLSAMLFMFVGYTVIPRLFARPPHYDVQELEKDLREIRPVSSEKALPDFVIERLRKITEKEDATSKSSEGMSRRLSIVGVGLIILATLSPIVAGVLYWFSEPIGLETSKALKLLADSAIATEPIRVERDWRILVGGMSFGFLLLAAGRGLLRQAAEQRRAYNRARRRVAYYEGVISAVVIANKSDSENKSDPILPSVVLQILNVLLEGSAGSEGELHAVESTEFPSKEQLKTILELVRK